LSSATDPIRSLQRREQATVVIALVVVFACAWRALAPAEPVPTIPPADLKPPATQQTEIESNQAIDPSVFTVTLWNPPPAAPPPEEVVAKVEPPKPLNLQLIGIIQEAGGHHKAAIYDVDRDQLLIVASGDRVREQTVTAVTMRGIELSDGRSTHTLTLKQEPS
jgi:hypothetical protein